METGRAAGPAATTWGPAHRYVINLPRVLYPVAATIRACLSKKQRARLTVNRPATLLEDVDAALLPPSVGGTADFSWAAVVDQALRDGEGWPRARRRAPRGNVVEVSFSETESELGVTISS